MDYEKKYKEAFERAKEVYNEHKAQPFDVMLKVFPELKESEDEKIRKAIVATIHLYYGEYLEDEAKEMIAWLENQKTSEEALQYLRENHSSSEMSDFQAAMNIAVAKAYDKGYNDGLEKQGEIYTKRDIDNAYLEGMAFAKDELEKQNKQILANSAKTCKDEQQPTDNDMKELLHTEYEKGRADAIAEMQKSVDCIDCTNSKGCINCKDGNMKETLVRKPAWSEEDELKIDFISKLILGLDQEKYDSQCMKELADWLKSLKDRMQPQPKQEWSQNDIDMIDWLIRCCEKEHEELCNDKYGHQDIVSDLKKDCRKKWNWLESLKNKVVPQNRWKPSDEQMKALNEAIYHVDDSIATQIAMLLEI